MDSGRHLAPGRSLVRPPRRRHTTDAEPALQQPGGRSAKARSRNQVLKGETMANKRELEDQVARLTVLVEEMRARLANLEGTNRPAGADVPRSRRDILRLG